jgi:TonB family protein
MSQPLLEERKPCVRCERKIDAAATRCLFCNWDQAATPAAKPAPKAAPAYVPPPDNRARNKILGAIAFAALLIIAFVVGSFVHGFDSKEVKAAPTKAVTRTEAAPPAEPQPQANITLVPVQEQQADNTALMTQQLGAQQQPVAQGVQGVQGVQNIPITDPRMITSNAPPTGVTSGVTPPMPQQAQHAPQTNRVPVRVAARPHTEPIPQYQPVPPIRVDRETTARLELTVGSDGRVRDIDVIQPVAGETPRLINAVQNWRFRPATVAGQPVTSRFTVNITFHAS